MQQKRDIHFGDALVAASLFALLHGHKQVFELKSCLVTNTYFKASCTGNLHGWLHLVVFGQCEKLWARGPFSITREYAVNTRLCEFPHILFHILPPISLRNHSQRRCVCLMSSFASMSSYCYSPFQLASILWYPYSLFYYTYILAMFYTNT